MTQFVNHTLEDLRGGRESWRVLLVVCSVAFAVAFVVGLNATSL
ncbi:MAG TPA: hypothetical protein VGF48_24270 [Thermoanaerobaculia bacterium]|jgi:hypothetical protein